MPHEPRVQPLADRVVTMKTRSKTVRRIVGLLPLWVTPNRVTAFRGLLAVPLFLALAARRYDLALATFTLAMALDALDGAIAHVRDMHTALGAFMDPLADKLLVYGAMLALWTSLPPWIALLTAGSLAFAVGITLARIVRLVRARNLRGPAVVEAIAAKTPGKVKTMFDVIAAIAIIAGLAFGSRASVDVGGAAMIVGTALAGAIHLSRSR
jgi:phosphatidylglycerophosphate synthase